MPGFRKNRPLRPFTWLLLLGAVAFAAGCSTSNENSSVGHLDAQGNSVAGWVVPFPGPSAHSRSATFDYINTGTSNCSECHGDALNGGIAKVSCVNSACHHNPLVTGWGNPALHGAAAKRAPGSSSFFSCQICHGSDFSGGVAGFACANCHAPPHPEPAPNGGGWLPGSPRTHVDTDASNAPVCAQCHRDGRLSPIPPPTPPAPPGTPPGCFNNTLCHGAVPHAVPFNNTTHTSITSATFPANCGICHAVTGASPDPGAPLCTTCHVGASPLTAINCTSCHAGPQNGPNGLAPAGAVYPNIPGAHATHVALKSAGSPVSCDTCHNGLGTNTLNHYNRANARPGSDAQRVPPGDAAFPGTYDAQTGASSFDNSALSCSNVGCHGGQTTPNWQTGAIVVNDQCTICHVLGTTQFNSYNSGEHAFHVNLFGAGAATCKLCHDTTALAVNHFTTLADNSISPAVASATIGGPFITTWTPGAGTSGTCNATCHPGDRTW